MTIQRGFSQRNFSYGQYDREYQASRSDVTQNGMTYCRNIISSPLGEAKPRPGSSFLKQLEEKTVLIPYRIDDSDHVVAVSENKIRIYDILPDGTLDEFVQAAENLPFPTSNWSSNTQGVWTAGMGPNHPTTDWNMFNSGGMGASVSSLGTWASNADNRYIYMNPSSGGILRNFKYRIYSDSGSWSTSKEPQNYFALNTPEIQYSDDGSKWFAIKTQVTNTQNDSWSQSRHRDFHSTKYRYYRNTGAEIHNYYYNTPHKYWRVYFKGYYNGVYGSSVLYVTNVSFSSATKAVFEFDAKITEDELQAITYAEDFGWGGGNTLVMTRDNKLPYKIQYKEGKFTVAEFPQSVFTSHGYPRAVAFYQNRLWFAGFEEHPNRVIASKFGDYDNWTIPSTLVAASPIVSDCNQITTKITDLYAGWDVLYAQCPDGVATIEAGDSTIAPNNQRFLLKIDRKSAGVHPTVKDNYLFFVSATRRDIYVINFDLIASKYNVTNINKFSHGYLDSGIREFHYVDTQARLIYGTLTNGNMFALLFDETAGTLGVYPLETDGEVFDISVMYYNNQNRLYATIRRNNTWTIEVFNPVIDFEDTNEFGITPEEQNERTKDGLTRQHFVDCAINLKDEYSEEWTLSGNTLSQSNHWYAWGDGYYTDTPAPEVGDIIYNAEKQPSGHVVSAVEAGYIEYVDGVDTVSLDRKNVNLEAYAGQVVRFFTADGTSQDLKITGHPTPYSFTVDVSGEMSFLSLQCPITEFSPEIMNDKFQAFDGGRYLGDFVVENNMITLKEPAYDITYGFPYRKIGVIQNNEAYLRKKKWGTIALNVMDTLSLKLGASLDKMEDVMKWKGDDFYNSSPILRNGVLVRDISEKPENVKHLIFMTDEGLPFCIRAIEAAGEMTDRNQG